LFKIEAKKRVLKTLRDLDKDRKTGVKRALSVSAGSSSLRGSFTLDT